MNTDGPDGVTRSLRQGAGTDTWSAPVPGDGGGSPPASSAPYPTEVQVRPSSSGGVSSFEEFCRNNYAQMVRSLALALNSPELGADAAGEAFARAWQRWSTVAAMANPQGWVYRVGVNWGRSRLRRLRREVSVHDIGGASEANSSEHRGSDEAPIADPVLAAAIANLGPKHRAVVVAKFYLDWSEADIAAALKIRPGTVKSRLSRALQQLSTSTRSR